MKRTPRQIGICILLFAVLLAGCGSVKQTEAAPSGDLEIAAGALTSEPSLIDWREGETPMQLIALREESGEVRLAFNTCQSCNGSPWAWFEYLGDGSLQCQNCMLTFPLSSVGAEGVQGCSPIRVPAFTERDGKIIVSARVLAEAAPLFQNWKETGE